MQLALGNINTRVRMKGGTIAHLGAYGLLGLPANVGVSSNTPVRLLQAPRR